MDEETGRIVVLAIASLGVMAWLLGLVVVLRATRERRESGRRAAERFDIEGTSAPGTIVGEGEVEGQPEELSVKLAGRIAREGVGPFGPIKILARSRDEVAFEPAGRSMMGFRRGQVRLTPAGPRTRIDYALETTPNGMLLGAWIALALGLAVVIVVPWLMFAYVLSSPNPNVRGQVVQAFQMVHFLWPPFLFAHLSRQPGRMFRAQMEALVHNLPY